ncbi:MAG: multiheme c-type cytochrome [Acidobacteriota bacterium]
MKKIIIIFLLIIFTLLISFRITAETKKSQLKKVNFENSKKCGECHKDIYNYWKNSLHSMSITDPIFEASYLEAYKETEGKAKYLCVVCHAPIAAISEDYEIKKDISKEGINCDFCHSIKDINLNQNIPFIIETGKIKYGPLYNVESPEHPASFSSVHTTSLICASCHEYKNNNGVLILGTYSEWKNGPYNKEGVICQNCHMPAAPGYAVKESIKRPTKKWINLHDISGSHSIIQLKKAVSIRILKTERVNNMVYVEVVMENVGSGHMIPTGIPSRKLILYVSVKTKSMEYPKIIRKEYFKLLVDEKGKEIQKDYDFFYSATKVLMDNRLGPKEKRIEKFEFYSIPENEKVDVRAWVSYLYLPSIFKSEKIEFEMSSDEKKLIKK